MDLDRKHQLWQKKEMEGYTKIAGRVKRSVRRHGLWSYLVEEDGKESWYPHGTVIENPPFEVWIKTEEYNKKHKLDV